MLLLNNNQVRKIRTSGFNEVRWHSIFFARVERYAVTLENNMQGKVGNIEREKL